MTMGTRTKLRLNMLNVGLQLCSQSYWEHSRELPYLKFIFNKLCVSSVGCANWDDLLLKVLITFYHSHTQKIENIEIFMVGWLALDREYCGHGMDVKSVSLESQDKEEFVVFNSYYLFIYEFANCWNGNLTNYQVWPTTRQLYNLIKNSQSPPEE